MVSKPIYIQLGAICVIQTLGTEVWQLLEVSVGGSRVRPGAWRGLGQRARPLRAPGSASPAPLAAR